MIQSNEKIIPFVSSERLHHFVLFASEFHPGVSHYYPDPDYLVYSHRIHFDFHFNYSTFAVNPINLSFFHSKPTFYLKDVETVNSDYYVFRDVEANGVGCFRFNSVLTFLPRYHHSLHAESGPNVAVVEEVIYYQHEFMFMFGHLIKDFLSGLYNIPKDVKERAQVVVGKHALTNVTIELLDILGFNVTNPVIIKTNEWIFARIMHCVIPRRKPTHGHYGAPLVRLRDKLRQLYNLSNSEPRKYVLFNRNSRRRKLLNFNESFNALKKEFPDKQWYYYITHFPTAKESAYQWNQFKLVVCPTGSLGSNSIFMQSGKTGMVSLYATDFLDMPLIAALLTYNIYHTSVPLVGAKHFTDGGGVAIIKDLIEATKNCLHAIETGKWLSYTEPFPYNYPN